MTDSVPTFNSNILGEWPDFFPNDVPPPDTYPPAGDFFRITNKKSPSKKCLASDFEKHPDDMNMRTGLRLICSYGVSIQNTIEGARLTVGKFRNATQRRFIAKATLNGDVGRIKQTFSEEYHHTLWVYKDSDIHKCFSCVEVVEPR